MPFKIPNVGAVTYEPQAGVYDSDIDALVLSINQTGVVYGCDVTAQGSPNMTAAVAAGLIRFAANEVLVAAGNVTITGAHSTNPRIDLVVVDNSGVKSVVAGVAAAITTTSGPVPPAIPANSVVLAQVYVDPGTTQITTTKIVDKRAIVASLGKVINLERIDPTVDRTGTTAATSAFSSALDRANTLGGIVYVPAGTYACGAIDKTFIPRIVFETGAKVKQVAGLGAGSIWWRFRGSMGGTSAALASNANAYTNSITLVGGSVAALGGLAKGDVLRLSQDIAWTTDPARSTDYQGILVTVESVAGEVVTLSESLPFNFTTAGLAKVWKMAPIRNGLIIGLNMEGQTGNTVRCLSIEQCAGLTIRDANISANGADGIELIECTQVNLEASGVDLAGSALMLSEGNSHHKLKVDANRCRSAIMSDTDNGSRAGLYDIKITNGQAVSCTEYGYMTDASGVQVHVENCTVSATKRTDATYTAGIHIATAQSTVRNCNLFGNTSHIGFGHLATDIQVVGNTCLDTIILAQGGHGHGMRSLTEYTNLPLGKRIIKGNTFRNIQRSIVRFTSTTSTTAVWEIVDNYFHWGTTNETGEQAFFKATSSSVKVGNLTDAMHIANNRFDPAGTAPDILYGGSSFQGTVYTVNNRIKDGTEYESGSTGATVVSNNDFFTPSGTVVGGSSAGGGGGPAPANYITIGLRNFHAPWEMVSTTASDGTRGIEAWETNIGKTFGLIGWGHWWRNSSGGNWAFDTTAYTNAHNNGSVNVVDWSPWQQSGGSSQPAYNHDAIISGTYDATMTAYITSAVSWCNAVSGRYIVLRPMHEMNMTGQFPWQHNINGNSPAKFILAWQKIYNVVRSVSGATVDKIKFYWCPGQRSDTHNIALSSFWPGASYVQIVGADAYNYNTPWLTMMQAFRGDTVPGGPSYIQDTYGEIMALSGASNLPFWIGETGAVRFTGDTIDYRRSMWFQEAVDELYEWMPKCRAVIWYDHDDYAETFMSPHVAVYGALETALKKPHIASGRTFLTY